MQKHTLARPLILALFGLPGSGKSLFARQMADYLGISHVSSDRIRYELFENQTYSRQEDLVVQSMTALMTEQLLHAHVSVIYDMSPNRIQDRRNLRELAKKNGAEILVVWVQIDGESAFNRVKNRDRRTVEDKFNSPMNKEQFETVIRQMQPFEQHEQYVVISGKHLFPNQRSVVMKKLFQMGMLSDSSSGKIAKPELVNLVSQAHARVQRPNYNGRNILIR